MHFQTLEKFFDKNIEAVVDGHKIYGILKRTDFTDEVLIGETSVNPEKISYILEYKCPMITVGGLGETYNNYKYYYDYTKIKTPIYTVAMPTYYYSPTTTSTISTTNGFTALSDGYSI